MVDQLSSFADEVTRVAKEVGTEGKLGGQAQVEGVSGVWRGLTDNVNQLAGTLTTQVRAIADVSHGGDPGRPHALDHGRGSGRGRRAQGHDQPDDRATCARRPAANAEQDWLNSNLARFTGMMQGQRDLETVSRLIMSELTPLVGAQHGAFFMTESPDGEGDDFELRLIASYGYKQRKNVSEHASSSARRSSARRRSSRSRSWSPRRPTTTSASPPGLGEAAPVNVIVLPVLFEEQVLAVIELASFQPFQRRSSRPSSSSSSRSIGVVLNTISANMRTEELLEQSQALTAGAAEPVRGAAGASRRSSSSSNKRARGAGGVAQGLGGAAPDAAGGAAADQRGARGEGRSCSRSRTAASRSRTARSSSRARRSRRRPSSSRSRPSTSASSSRTCRTSCARRSTRC